MHKYTQDEFEDLPIVDGRRQCPTGDYSLVHSFGKDCSFGEDCSFGKECSFGKDCSFGEDCSFGKECSFGEKCSFGEWCSFGEATSFGEDCSFGKECSFGEGCVMCGHPFTHNYVLSVSGLEDNQWTLYIWMTEDGVYCQVGRFFGTEGEFVTAVKQKYGNNSHYLKALDLLKNIAA